MEFKLGKYHVTLTVNHLAGGFIFGFGIDYWAGILDGKVELFSYVITFSISKPNVEE